MGYVKQAAVGFFKSCFNVKAWINYPSMKNQFSFFLNIFKSIYLFMTGKTRPSIVKESFDEMVQRLNIDEAFLQKRLYQLKIQAFVFFGLGILALGYSIYLTISTGMFVGLIGFMLSIAIVAMGISAHFNAFQIQRRQLSCTFKEYLFSQNKRAK